MSKIILNSISNLQNEDTAVSSINTNSSTLQTAFDNTLSRDGTMPNQMMGNLDMNSQQILNLPSPITPNSPIRVTDLSTFTGGGAITFAALPTGGTLNQLLTKNSSTNYDATWKTYAPDYNGQVLLATNFSGATVGNQIANAIAALPSTGGVVDARGLPSGGTWPAMTISASNYTLLLPCGYINVTGTIQLYNASGIQGVRWLGNGGEFGLGGTLFLWAASGNSTDPLLRLRGVRDSYFEDFSIQANGVNPLGEGIRLESATGTTSSRRIFKNILINGITNNITKGFRWAIGDDCTGGAGADLNNDVDSLHDVEVSNYSNTAFSIEHSQSKSHMFMNCQFNAAAVGQRGVATTQAANSLRNSGSFRWYGGSGGGTTVVDFDLGSADDNILISGANFESSNRLLQTATSSVPWTITLIGCRWAANNLNADAKVVDYKAHGGLSVIGCHVELVNGVPASNPTFNITPGSPSSNAAGFAAGNNIYWGTAASTNQPFVSSGGSYWTTFSNVMSDVGTTNVFNIPNLIPSLVTAGLIKSSSSSAGIGYATGAGGTVTQLTSKSTGVTINKTTGQIVTFNTSMGAGVEMVFTVTNSTVAATDVVIVNMASGGTTGSYLFSVSAVTAGSFDITISNASAGTLVEALTLNFAVIKGVTT